ncbi:MAG TPA: transcriptional repressor [Bacilli bacterium]|nr:transcriptional repressor [Bacilli bacterium]
MKKSYQREIILKVVRESCDHPSALTIYERVREIIPNISLGTVYRNLNALAVNDYIKRIGVSNESDRFDKTITDHHHIRCIKCNNVVDIFDESYNDFCNKIELETEYKVLSHDLVFEGICHDCLKKEGI